VLLFCVRSLSSLAEARRFCAVFGSSANRAISFFVPGCALSRKRSRTGAFYMHIHAGSEKFIAFRSVDEEKQFVADRGRKVSRCGLSYLALRFIVPRVAVYRTPSPFRRLLSRLPTGSPSTLFFAFLHQLFNLLHRSIVLRKDEGRDLMIPAFRHYFITRMNVAVFVLR